ncbi:hypothetical protein [Streptomyces sp. NRRL S-481]|uniref:hypothetical protein n=1 Tax=Streptomyces sp. NRRL S-481 TaxID=1463911 RepID=UPI00131B5B08|nr:hypothetical protein [Streptomyces sp. NRRL S-481]
MFNIFGWGRLALVYADALGKLLDRPHLLAALTHAARAPTSGCAGCGWGGARS